MKEAGREESELAKKYGEVDKDEISVITVVADGAWCKWTLSRHSPPAITTKQYKTIKNWSRMCHKMQKKPNEN
ncbi:hypothetical protein ILUMI_16239 [Ignelater luminosus]|uniref:Uncharacterized protein n=1 Tax=Ignelater luminosus TaxID=2038154 RepID=A0A8K0G8E0_IGNLU|nr:hypothetical protein ILUMI_16239 [Ignelater luminosus]